MRIKHSAISQLNEERDPEELEISDEDRAEGLVQERLLEWKDGLGW